MIQNLTSDLYQSYSNDSESIQIELLYNNTFNYFYFVAYENGVVIQGDTKIVNNYENKYLKFYSLTDSIASFEDIESFTLEMFDA